MEEQKNYVVNMNFIGTGVGGAKNIVEYFSTLEEAQSYKGIMDDTVKSACIVDYRTKSVIEWWRR